jgi:hypothetical protein
MQGVAEQVIDEFDDRRFTGAFFEVFDVLVAVLYQLDVVQVADELIDVVIEFALVEGVADLFNVLFQADHHIHRQSRLAFDVVNGKDIGRIA